MTPRTTTTTTTARPASRHRPRTTAALAGGLAAALAIVLAAPASAADGPVVTDPTGDAPVQVRLPLVGLVPTGVVSDRTDIVAADVAIEDDDLVLTIDTAGGVPQEFAWSFRVGDEGYAARVVGEGDIRLVAGGDGPGGGLGASVEGTVEAPLTGSTVTARFALADVAALTAATGRAPIGPGTVVAALRATTALDTGELGDVRVTAADTAGGDSLDRATL